jgi:hypothetical protein
MVPGLDGVKRAARRAARNAVIGVLAGLFALTGAGFATTAAFIGLMHLNGPVFAALVLALVYGGLAAILAAVVISGKPEKPPETAQTPLNWAGLAQAFVIGLNASRNLRRRD